MGSNVLVAAFKDLSSGAFGVALDIIITKSRPCENCLDSGLLHLCTSESSENQPLKKEIVKFSEVIKCESPLENFHMVSTLLEYSALLI